MPYDGFYSAIEVWQREQRNPWPILLQEQVNTCKLKEWRQHFKQQVSQAPSYTAFVVYAIGKALSEVSKAYPELNSFLRKKWFGWGPPEIVCFPKVSVGVTAAISYNGHDSVVVGVIPEPHRLDLLDLTKQIRQIPQDNSPWVQQIKKYYQAPQLVKRIASWHSLRSEMARFNYRGTANVTSGGVYGLHLHSLPQSATLQFGFGAIQDQVIAVHGKPEVHPCFSLSMSFDRRLMSLKPPATLIKRIIEILENAEFDEAPQ